MGAISAIGTAVRGVTTNPILLVLTGAFALLQVPTLLVQPADPVLGMIVQAVVLLAILAIGPFYQGGLIAMADEARTGRTTLETFLQAGKANYVPLLLAILLVVAVFVGIGMIGGVGAMVVGGALILAGDVSAGTLAVVGLLALLVGLVSLVVVYFFQFFGQAIVLSDAGPVEGFQVSARLVRQNLLSVAGYTLLVTLAGSVFGVFGAFFSFVGSPEPIPGLPIPEATPAVLAGSSIAFVVAAAIWAAFFATYTVSYYRDLEAASTGV